MLDKENTKKYKADLDLATIEPIENIYQDLQDKEDSDPSLGLYCNRKIVKDPSKRLAIILTGFTCVGKDTVMDRLKETGEFFHVVTATSRPRRVDDNEPESKYVWLNVRPRREGESVSDYVKYVKEEEGLVEADEHYGYVYGLPLSSLEKEGQGIPVIRPDINGTLTLMKELPKFNFQPISIALMPDSWEQIYRTIMQERGGNLQRLLEDLKTIDKYKDPNIINYYVHNSRYRYGNMTGLERSTLAILSLLKQYFK